MVVAFLICFALRQGTSKDAIELIWCLQSMPLGMLPPLRGIFFPNDTSLEESKFPFSSC